MYIYIYYIWVYIAAADGGRTGVERARDRLTRGTVCVYVFPNQGSRLGPDLPRALYQVRADLFLGAWCGASAGEHQVLYRAQHTVSTPLLLFP